MVSVTHSHEEKASDRLDRRRHRLITQSLKEDTPDFLERHAGILDDYFNEAYQTEAHEAKRDDENFCHAAAWEFSGEDSLPQLHKEHLVFENVELTQRSYK